MFRETQEALAHQTASADILRVISSSPTDVQPVFEAIVGTAVKHLAATSPWCRPSAATPIRPRPWPPRPASRPCRARR